jgi:prepilin-type N-terminal cleavage/methylation domain-containing protein
MKNFKAFSLIELSIVILIIGILVAGVTQSSRLVRQMKIKSIQNITSNSPIPSIKDLMIWLETSQEKSFIEAEQQNSSPISVWYDNNITSIDKNNATSPALTNYPIYVENVFNGVIPGLRFDGINDFFSFNSLGMINSNFTVFVIESRRSAGGNQFFLGGSVTGNFHIGYSLSTQITAGRYGVAGSDHFNYAIPAYVSPTPRIHTFLHSSTLGKKYWLNGGLNPEASSNNTLALTVYNGVIGNTESTWFYAGDIGEIIIYNRALNNEERMAIEEYLGKKFQIIIS